MKHSILSCALLGALAAGSACAADTQIYGVVDTGFSVRNNHYVNGDEKTTTAMMSGQYIGSRFGIKCFEDLGNGMKAGFVLESSIKSDDGSLGQNGRHFGREARVYLAGDFGEVSFGRVGPIVGGNGPYARFAHVMNAFSCGWGDIGGHLQVVSLGYEYLDNAVAYKTPTVAGLDATVQYSFGSLQVVSLGYEFVDNTVNYLTPKFGGFDAVFQYSFGADAKNYGSGTEGKSSVERMYAGAVRYQDDVILVSAGIEGINQAQPAARAANLDDALSFNLGGSYNAGFAKFYAYGQVFRDYAKAAKVTMFAVPSGVDGYGVNLGFETKALGGTVKGSFGWGDFDGSHESDKTMKTYQTAVGYAYSLSRRTTLYTAAGWIHNDFSNAYETSKPTAVENDYEWICGITHKF